MNKVDIKVYFFDWDDNILHLDSKINLEYLNDGVWVPVTVTTAEFALIRNDSNYRIPNEETAFLNFGDKGPLKGDTFLLDCIDAVNKKKFGPSYEAFKKCLINGNLFFIITARKHEPDSIRRSVEYFIFNQLTKEEIETMLSNIRYYFLDVFKKEVISDSLLTLYLNQCGYTGVSSESFISSVDTSIVPHYDQSNVELGKEIAIDRYVRDCVRMGQKLGDNLNSISIGFSDDDPKNIKHVIHIFKNELKLEFPDVKFVVYDTSKKADGSKNYIKNII